MSDHDPHGEGHAADDGWCSVNEAARRLSVTPTAIRNRIKRRTLETKPNGNHGRLVWVPRPVPRPVPRTVTLPSIQSGFEGRVVERCWRTWTGLAQIDHGRYAHLAFGRLKRPYAR